MKSRTLLKTALLALLALAASSNDTFAILFDEPPELAKIFNDRGIAGTFVMLDARADTTFVWNQKRANQQSPPAATSSQEYAVDCSARDKHSTPRKRRVLS